MKPRHTHLLPSTRFIGAVAGAVAEEEVVQFAHENGLYVIVQSGEAVEIITPPEGLWPKRGKRQGRPYYGAIHRSILTGFLSGITCRSERFDYTTAGDTGQGKFYIWPGSRVFGR